MQGHHNPNQLSQADSRYIDEVLEKVPVAHRDKARQQIEEQLTLVVLTEQFGEEFLRPNLWGRMPDDEVVGIMDQQSRSSGGKETFLRRLALEFLEQPGLELENTAQRDQSLKFVELALQTSLVKEYEQRFKSRETEQGHSVRSFLNQRDDPARQKLIRHANRPWWYHPELSEEGGKEEIASMVELAVWKRISKLPDFFEGFRERLTDMLRGEYNRIPDNARKSVVGQLETIAKRSMRSLDDLPQNEDGDVPEEHPILVEYATDRYEAENRHRGLIDHYLKHEDLPEEDKELLRLLREGFTQEEVARMRGTTQPAISQQRNRILSQLRQSQEAQSGEEK